MEGSSEVLHENGKDDPAPSCKWWYKVDGNCRITHCFQDETQEGDEPRTRTGGEIFSFYDPVRSRCVGLRSGGEFTGALEFLNVYNDEDQSGTASVASAPGRILTEHESGIVEGESTLEEYLEWLNDTAPAQAAKRGEPIIKGRQNEDDVVRIDFTAFGIRNPDAYENGPRLSKGVGYKYEVSESTKFGVTTSLNLGATWNIFTASAGIEMSQEDTYTVTEGLCAPSESTYMSLTFVFSGLTFDVNCANQGQVTFWPFYDYYETTWSPSETKGEIWVPVEVGDKKINGEIAVGCVG